MKDALRAEALDEVLREAISRRPHTAGEAYSEVQRLRAAETELRDLKKFLCTVRDQLQILVDQCKQ